MRRTVGEFGDDHLLQWSAALAFFSALSLFPALLTLASVLGVLGTPALEPLIDNVAALAPGPWRDIALDALATIKDNRGAAGPTLAGSLAVAIWSASAYVGAFIPASNVVWEVRDARPFLQRLRVRMALTITLLVLIGITAVSVVLTGPIAEQVGEVVGAGDAALTAWNWAKWPVLAVVLMALVALLYWASPNVLHPGWRWIVPGSMLAVALWMAASLGFTFYVSNIASFNALYGSIGGVLVFLLWLWVSNLAVLLGAEFTAELERTRAIHGGLQPPDRTPFLPRRDGTAAAPAGGRAPQTGVRAGRAPGRP